MVSADKIKLYWIRVSNNLKNGVLTRNGEFGHRKRHSEAQGDHVTAQAEIGVICLQGKEYQGLSATTRS